MFSFDPVGSYEREVYRAAGSASSLLQPLLDNQVLFHIKKYFVSRFICFSCIFPTESEKRSAVFSAKFHFAVL